MRNDEVYKVYIYFCVGVVSLVMVSCTLSPDIHVGDQGIVKPRGGYKYCMVAVSPERFKEGISYQNQDNTNALIDLEIQGQITSIPRGTEVTVLETDTGLENRLAKVRVITDALYEDEVYIEQSCVVPKN